MANRDSQYFQPTEFSSTFSPDVVISSSKNNSLTLSELNSNPTIHLHSFLGINDDSKIWAHCECISHDGTPRIIKLAEAASVNTSGEFPVFSCEIPLQELADILDNSVIQLLITACLKKTTIQEPHLFALYEVPYQREQTEINYARWMTDSVPGIEHLKLHELVLLSAHNAGVDQKNVGWPTGQYGACQDDSFTYQLNNGARVLDLRLYRNIDEIGTPKEFIFKHSNFHASRYLYDCLQFVRNFAQQNPMEFIILDFHTVEAAGGEHQINSAILDFLRDHNLPKDAANLTIGEIRNKYPGKNVITAWDNNLSYTTWPRITHQWSGEDLANESDLYEFTRKTMLSPPSGNLWSHQAVGYNFISGPIRYDSNRPFWRLFFDEKFYNYYRSPTKGNIINVDFLVGTGAAQKCINATRTRAAAAANSASRNLTISAEASWALLSWEAPQDTEQVTNYALFRDNTHIQDIPPIDLGAFITFLKPETTYKFTIIAAYPSGNGAPSVITTTTKSPKPTAPTKPKNSIASDKTHNSVTLSWAAAPPSENVAGYIIWINNMNPITTTENSYRVTGLSSGVRYEVYTSAFNSKNEVSAASAINAFTLEPLLPPDTPKNLRGTPLLGKIKLDWDPAQRATRYQVISFFSTILETTSTTVTFNVPDIGRDYVIVAINEHGESSNASNIIWIKPIPPEAPGEPGPPKNFRVAYKGTNSVNFTWDIAQYAVRYEIFRMGSVFPSGSTRDTNLTVTGLQPGVPLLYFVLAYYVDGSKSGMSNVIFASP
jgi:1-phosphatidylinositol phosphodiesterase